MSRRRTIVRIAAAVVTTLAIAALTAGPAAADKNIHTVPTGFEVGAGPSGQTW